jgi:hypothetical protein
MPSPIDMLIDTASMRCTVCGARAGTCQCWIQCSCGWIYQRGSECRNHAVHGITMRCPNCKREQAAPRDATDPPGTAVVQATCDRCDRGDFAEVIYFDRNGRQLAVA